ncbi:MAG: hypothetical protein KatS3mg027_0718 [Bacteroidia bacterium]|nr:MAG: hypothetical protein KatS3mg027_0718 [Bacteroidia bacterium]
MKHIVFIIIISFILLDSISAQQSCNWYTHLNGAVNEYVYKIRPLNNQHLLICGSVDKSGKIDTTTYFNCNLPSGFIAEFDEQKNVIFTKTFLNTTSTNDPNYFQTSAICKDVIKDNNGNYYAAVNFTGTLKLDSMQWNAEKGLLVVKLNASGQMLWHFFLEKTVLSSMCFDNSNNLVLLAYSPIQMYYTPANLFLIKLNTNNGATKKYLIGNNAFSDIKTGEMVFKDSYFYLTCSFVDSIDFSNSQKIKSPKNSTAVLKLDTNWIIQNYVIFTGKDNKNNIINDLDMDSNGNIFVIGTYNSNNLHINDTIRLTKSTIASRMFLTKLNSNFQHLWTKQEVQNPANINTYGMREGCNLTLDNQNNLYALGYYYNSIILGTDTFTNNSLLLFKYDNNGQYLLSEKIAGVSGKTYNLEYFNNHLYLSAPFTSTVTVCQNTLSSSGSFNDTYIAEMDKLTNISSSQNEFNPISIFPNPAHQFIFISNNLNEKTEYEIVDITGKIVRSGIIEHSYIPVRDLVNGAYILQLKTNKRNSHFKILIQH